jgi:hypothetical protein
MPVPVDRLSIGVIPAKARVGKPGGQGRGSVASVIPAQAGILLTRWNKLLYGSPPPRGRRCGENYTPGSATRGKRHD